MVIGILVIFSEVNAGAPEPPLKLSAAIPLPGVKGRIDHLAFEPKHQRLFVAALGNNSVEVVDLKTKNVIHSIKNLSEPQGIVYIPQTNSVFVANGGNGKVEVFDAKTYQRTAIIQLPGDADNVRYDSLSMTIYVGYGEGGIALIDARTFLLKTEITLSAHPESFQLDISAAKIYVNVPGRHQVEVIDLTKKRVTTRWELTQAVSNFPMCLEESLHQLFIGCRRPPKLLVKDTKSGETVYSVDIEGDVDDIFYNKAAKQIYLSCGSGYVDVFQQFADDKYIEKGKIRTHRGARTCLFIPELQQLIVASPADASQKASLLILSIP